MNKKVRRKILLWRNLTHFYELCSIHGQSVKKVTNNRYSSKLYADGDLTFAAGEQSEHELVLTALSSHEPTFKTSSQFKYWKSSTSLLSQPLQIIPGYSKMPFSFFTVFPALLKLVAHTCTCTWYGLDADSHSSLNHLQNTPNYLGRRPELSNLCFLKKHTSIGKFSYTGTMNRFYGKILMWF